MRCTRFLLWVLFLSVVLLGCVQMRDYVGEREGAMGLMQKKTFGKGEEVRKDYYVVSGGDGVVIGDVKDEVIAKLGLPDEVKTTFEGYEQWIYTDRAVSFYFEGERLIRWEQL
ncbi:MAG: hypothetical protein JW867_02470 [Candidatus Omnitrophica bacterium]|nr:hypothetical protein [Candidatus Omnitrophota bacterium]